MSSSITPNDDDCSVESSSSFGRLFARGAPKYDKERMLMHGFNDYLSKPIDINELETMLQKYI